MIHVVYKNHWQHFFFIKMLLLIPRKWKRFFIKSQPCCDRGLPGGTSSANAKVHVFPSKSQYCPSVIKHWRAWGGALRIDPNNSIEAYQVWTSFYHFYNMSCYFTISPFWQTKNLNVLLSLNLKRYIIEHLFRYTSAVHVNYYIYIHTKRLL